MKIKAFYSLIAVAVTSHHFYSILLIRYRSLGSARIRGREHQEAGILASHLKSSLPQRGTACSCVLQDHTVDLRLAQ